MKHYEVMKEEAKQCIRRDKDRAPRIATITLDCPGAQNASMRRRYDDLVHRVNTDDDVKVLVIRGERECSGSGGGLPEQAHMLSGSGADVDLKCPPEWRPSRSGRNKP